MSIDPKAEVPPMGHMEQRPSRKKWWMMSGCGCLVFLLLCCGGFGYFGYTVAKPFQDIVQESQTYARSSDTVAEAVGKPVAVSDQPKEMMPRQFQEDGVDMLEFRYLVDGSTAKGELVLKISMAEPFKFVRKSLSLELEDGTVIDLNPEEEFSLDIDVGDDIE